MGINQKWGVLLGGFFLTLGLSLTLPDLWRQIRFSRATPAEQLQWAWEDDLIDLNQRRLLPKEWKDIREIQLIPTDDFTKASLHQLETPITLNEKGQFRLEILMVSWQEAQQSGVIFQYNLTNMKTKNQIWEMGRTFTLMLNKKTQQTPEKLRPVK